LKERQPFDAGLLKYPTDLTLKITKNLCDGQRYNSQPAPGFCSGTLIDDDVILTAAHCVFGVDLPDTTEMRVVFNHYNIATDAPADIECDTPAGQICDSQDVFRFRPILVGDRFTDVHEDWAILQLVDATGNSKPATRYRPAPVRQDLTPLEFGTPLAKIGAPNGIPLKISLSKAVQGNGGVLNVPPNDPKAYFAFLEAFRGDSGGGVYDAQEFNLVALVSGGPNFVIDGKASDFVPRLPDKTCNIAGICPMSVQRRQELEAAGVTVNCQSTTGQLRPEEFVRVDVPLSHLCGVGTDVPPLPFFRPPQDFESVRLCARTANETCDTAEPFQLKVNHELTLAGDTSAFSHDADASCGTTPASPDAFYSFEVPENKRVMFYADTFGPGNTFDTVLFLQRDCPASSEIICNDDTALCPTEGNDPHRRSRFAVPLDAGTYFLGISGFDGQSGRYSIHVQVLDLSDNGILLDPSQLGSPLFMDENTNNSTASGTESFCGLAGAKDFQVLYATCPDYVGGPIFATTCDFLTAFDTVLSFAQGSRPFSGCHDDMLLPGCFRTSSLGFDSLVKANSGSGIRSVFVDGFSAADSGRFGLLLEVPP